MEENNEKLVCIRCGSDELGEDVFGDKCCAKCDGESIVSLSEYQRFESIKGTFQLFIGHDNQEPSVIIPLHTNKFGWIVAKVVNTQTTIFPDLKNIVEYDYKLHKKLLKLYQLAYHQRCIEKIQEESKSEE